MAGVEKTPGIAAAPEDMKVMGSSDTGSSHWTLRRIGSHQEHFHCVQRSLNWNVTNLAAAMCLISTSINNIVSFIRCYNGIDPATQSSHGPTTHSSTSLGSDILVPRARRSSLP